MTPQRVAVFILGFGLATSCSVSAQSLGDVARQQKAKPAPTSKKVITEDDLPQTESISTGPKEQAGAPPSSEEKQPPKGDSGEKPKSAEDYRAAIQAQKRAVEAMQKDLDELKASVHYVEANAYYNGVQYNEAQTEKQHEAERLQKQLEEQKAKLQEMQEQARKAGFGSSVYE